MVGTLPRLLILSCGVLLVPLDSAVNVAFPDIIEAFDQRPGAIAWVICAFVLTTALLVLPCGYWGDRWGHRKVFALGALISTLAYIALLWVPSFDLLIAARILQGIGGALVVSCGAALATSILPANRTGTAVGLYTLLFGLGMVLGSLLAGLLVPPWGWQSVFWFRLPLAAVALAGAYFLPENPASGRERPESGQIAATNFKALGFHSGSNFVLNIGVFTVPLIAPFALANEPRWIAGLALALLPLGFICSALMSSRQDISMAPHNRALFGLGMSVIALLTIAISTRQEWLYIMALAFFILGAGQGFYQTAFTAVVIGLLGSLRRGVAGSLEMLTRTLGMVTSAAFFSYFLLSGDPHDAAHLHLSKAALLVAPPILVFLLLSGLVMKNNPNGNIENPEERSK